MDDLDVEIAQLERKLAELHGRRRLADWEKPATEHARAQPFVLSDEEDLHLASMPDLARLILDALPVSVFVKFADIEPTRGRLYTYINKLARDRLRWKADEVASHYDSEAFLHEWQSPLYQTMLTQETKTLAGKAAINTLLEWQPEENFWRRSKTLEIPIFGRSDVRQENPIGFCAIAEEVEFKMFPFIHSWLRRVFNHEYRNMTFGVKAELERAIDYFNSLKELAIDGRSADLTIRDATDQIIQGINNAMNLLRVHGLAYEELYDAFSPKRPDDTETVGEIVDSIRQVFKLAPFKLDFRVNQETVTIGIRRWNVIKGVIIVLIGNAVKHADKGASPTAILEVYRQDDNVVWAVRNRCKAPTDRMTLRTFEDRSQADPSAKNLGGTIIGELLSRAFPALIWTEMLKDTAADGWVEYALHYKLVEVSTIDYQ